MESWVGLKLEYLKLSIVCLNLGTRWVTHGWEKYPLHTNLDLGQL
jgi:hypothetical protein